MEVPNFAEHSHQILGTLTFAHVGILSIFAVVFIWVLFGYYQLGNSCFENKKFSTIFTFLFTPLAILTCLSGAYLYFVSTVIYSSDPNLPVRAFMYISLAVLYFGSVIYIFKAPQPKKSPVVVLSCSVVLSAALLISTYFGVNYG